MINLLPSKILINNDRRGSVYFYLSSEANYITTEYNVLVMMMLRIAISVKTLYIENRKKPLVLREKVDFEGLWSTSHSENNFKLTVLHNYIDE